MTQEEKQLLFQDLCARLPYGVVYHRNDGANIKLNAIDVERGLLNYTDDIDKRECKPYLRPMPSMTGEEGERFEQIAKETLGDFMFEAEEDGGAIYHMTKWEILSPAMFDYLNSIHIDYRGMIEMGIALPAPEDMYK